MTADEPNVAARVPTEFEAHTIAAILHENGIEAAVAPGAPSWTGQMAISPTAQGSAVVVRSEDLQRAQAILRECKQDSVDLDWDEVDVGERDDDLPLSQVGRMPIAAILAAATTAAILIVSAIVGLILLINAW